MTKRPLIILVGTHLDDERCNEDFLAGLEQEIMDNLEGENEE